MKHMRSICVLLVVSILMLAASVTLAKEPETRAITWTGLCTCDNSLEVASVGAFRTKLAVYGGTTVHTGYYASVVVYLETLDEDNDWVTVTAWSDYDYIGAAVSTFFKVSAGTYRLYCIHRSYTNDSYTFPVDTHYTTSTVVVTH